MEAVVRGFPVDAQAQGAFDNDKEGSVDPFSAVTPLLLNATYVRAGRLILARRIDG
jgi:hypothetical protein